MRNITAECAPTAERNPKGFLGDLRVLGG